MSGGGAGVVVVTMWWYSLCSVVFVQGCNGSGSESICFDLVFEKNWFVPAMPMQVQLHWGMYFGSNFSITTFFFPMHRRNSRDWPLGTLDYVFGGRLTAWVGVHWIFLDS